jgi:hypothetical protein
MTEELAIELAKSLTTDYDLREVMIVINSDTPTDWSVVADFHDGGGELMDSVARIEGLVETNRQMGHDASFGGRYVTIR